MRARGDFALRQGTRLLNIALQTPVLVLKDLACRNEKTEAAARKMLGKHSADKTEERICRHIFI